MAASSSSGPFLTTSSAIQTSELTFLQTRTGGGQHHSFLNFGATPLITDLLLNLNNIKNKKKKPILIVQTQRLEVTPKTPEATVLDCYTDCRGWLDPTRINTLSTCSILKSIRKAAAEISATDIVLVFPAFHPILDANSESQVSKLLLSLQRDERISQIIILAHHSSSDLGHPQKIFTHLKSEAQTVVDIVGLEANPTTLDCFVDHRPSKGKPISVREVLSVNSEGQVSKIEPGKKSSAKAAPEPGEDEREALNKLSTFNLGLKDQEREARGKVVLPFWKAEQMSNKTRNFAEDATEQEDDEEASVRINPKVAPAFSGAIYYEPDEADDWDEEDPDDDLDF